MFVIRDSVAKNNYFIYSDPWKGENPATPPSGKEITLNDNTWHHVACTWNSGSTLALYIDGEAIWDSMAYTPTNNWTCNLMTLGVANQRGNRRLNGYLDEFRIYNVALEAAAIKQIYNYVPESINASIGSIKQSGIGALNCYPNPAVNTISFSNSLPVEIIEIYSITGEKLLIHQLANENVEINVAPLSSGFYIVRAYSHDKLVGMGKFLRK